MLKVSKRFKREARREIRRLRSERTIEAISMDEEEYLGKQGFGRGARPTASFIRSTKGMSGIALKRAQKNWDKVQRDFNAERERLRDEYKAKVKAGEIVPKGRMASLLQKAKGNPDRRDVQAARRLLIKRGLWTNQMSKKADQKFESRGTEAGYTLEKTVRPERLLKTIGMLATTSLQGGRPRSRRRLARYLGVSVKNLDKGIRLHGDKRIELRGDKYRFVK